MIIIIILMVGGYLKVDRDFVGREPLYRAISQDVQSACSGHSWLIALEGAPGIGKSTILSAIINDTKKANTLVVDSRAYEDVDLPPYWLWVPIVRALRSRLSATAFELSARIASDHGVPLDWLEKYESAEHGEAERRQIRLLEAIFAIIEAVVEDGPVVIAIDDLHRADKQSLFLLQYLLEQTRDLPCAFLVAYRSSESSEGIFTQYLDRLLNASRSRLYSIESFSCDEVREFIEYYFPALHIDVVDDYYARSDGHPLILRWLAEETESETGTGRKGTLDSFIGARFNRLSAAHQRLLLRLALFAYDFESSLVKIMSEDEDFADGIRQFQEDLFISRSRDGEYRFSHDLVRKAVSNLLSLKERRLIHLEIASTLESTSYLRDDLRPAILSHHFLRTGEDASIRKGIAYAFVCIKEAERKYAWEDALELLAVLQKSYEQFMDDLTRADLDLAIAKASLFKRIDYPARYQAMDHLYSAFRTYLRMQAVDRLVEISTLYRSSAEPEYIEYIGQAIKIIPEDHDQYARILLIYGFWLGFYGRARESESALLRSKEVAENTDESQVALSALSELAARDIDYSRFDQALEKCELVQKSLPFMDDNVLIALANKVYAKALRKKGFIDRSVSVIKDIKKNVQKTADKNLAYFADAYLQRAALQKGNWEEVFRYDEFETAINYLPIITARYHLGSFKQGDEFLGRLIPGIENDPKHWVWIAICVVAALAIRRRISGRPYLDEDALGWISALVAVPGCVSDIEVRARTAQALIAFENRDAGVLAAIEARLNEMEMFNPVDEHHIIRSKAFCAWGTGKIARAAALFDEAVSWCRYYRDMPVLAWTYSDLAEVYRDWDSRQGEADSYADKALAIAKDLHMQPIIDRHSGFALPSTLVRKLTARETEILSYVARGLADKEIARELGISAFTVSNHMKKIFSKLQCANRAEAAAMALQSGSLNTL